MRHLVSLYKGLILHNTQDTMHKQAHVSIVTSDSWRQICEHHHLHLVSSHNESNESNMLHLINWKGDYHVQ